MKINVNLLKTAILAFVLAVPAQILAQVYPDAPMGKVAQPSDLNGGLVTFDGTNESFAPLGGTVMFFRPTSVDPAGSGVNLSASLTDGNGNSFSSYLWHKVTYTGGSEDEGTPIAGETAATFNPTNLDPGYNKFRVRGETGSSVSSCPSTEYQDVIVFVLPQLDVTPEVNGTELVYCANDVPTGADAITLSADIIADYTGNTNDYPKPGEADADADFTLTYDWYAVPQGGGTAIQLGNTKDLDLATATNPLTPGTYEFYVEVEYDSGIRAKNTRNYVTYGGSTVVTSQTVVVTDTPGTPTISVLSVED